MAPSLIDDIWSRVDLGNPASVSGALAELRHHFPNFESMPTTVPSSYDIPQDNLLCKLDTNDLTSMRRVMKEIDDRFTLWVLRPSDLKGEESMFVNNLVTSIRAHPEECFMLLWATHVFIQSRHHDDVAIRKAISEYQSVGSARVLLAPMIYPDEYAGLEARYSARHGSGYRKLLLSHWTMLTPVVFEYAQKISTKRATQLDRIARETGRDLVKIPKEEAVGLLPQGPLLGPENVQTFNSGPCDDCKRRGRHCTRTEPSCQECLLTWNECCSYSTPSAGTFRDIQASCRVMVGLKRATSRLQPRQTIQGASAPPMSENSGNQPRPVNLESGTAKKKLFTLPTHSSQGVEYASIKTPFDQDYPHESSLSPPPLRLSSPFSNSELPEAADDHRSKSAVPSGKKRKTTEEMEEQQSSKVRKLTTLALAPATRQTTLATITEESLSGEEDEALAPATRQTALVMIAEESPGAEKDEVSAPATRQTTLATIAEERPGGEKEEDTIVAHARESPPQLNGINDPKVPLRRAARRGRGILPTPKNPGDIDLAVATSPGEDMIINAPKVHGRRTSKPRDKNPESSRGKTPIIAGRPMSVNNGIVKPSNKSRTSSRGKTLVIAAPQMSVDNGITKPGNKKPTSCRGKTSTIGARPMSVDNGVTKRGNKSLTSSRVTRSKSNKLDIISMGTIKEDNEDDVNDVNLEEPPQAKAKQLPESPRPTRASARIATLQPTSSRVTRTKGNHKSKQVPGEQEGGKEIIESNASIDGTSSQGVDPGASCMQHENQQVVPAANFLDNIPYLQSTNKAKAYQSPYTNTADDKGYQSPYPSAPDGKELHSVGAPPERPKPKIILRTKRAATNEPRPTRISKRIQACSAKK